MLAAATVSYRLSLLSCSPSESTLAIFYYYVRPDVFTPLLAQEVFLSPLFFDRILGPSLRQYRLKASLARSSLDESLTKTLTRYSNIYLGRYIAVSCLCNSHLSRVPGE